MDKFVLTYPHCQQNLTIVSSDIYRWAQDDLTYSYDTSIWHFLLPEYTAYFQQFVHEYETVREQEQPFPRQFGFRGNVHLSEDYPTFSRWVELPANVDITIVADLTASPTSSSYF